MKLYNADCLDKLKEIQDNSIDLIVTDPPYDVDNHGGGISKLGHRVAHKQIETISNSFDFAILDELCRVMKKINIYLFCSQKQLLPLINYFTNKHCNWNLLTWHKTNPIPCCNNKYLNDTEFLLFFREKGVPLYGTYETKKTYYVTPLNTIDKKLYKHPTCKPIGILKNLIINSSNENDTVLDPFMGSGSTGIACLNTNRNFVGIELDKTYFDIAQNRINKYMDLL